jgi:hypothetical protein
MPPWTHTYKVRRSTNILTFAVRQNWEALNLMGESCFLLKRNARANTTFQLEDRRIPTITRAASSFDIDPDTGMLRYKLWGESTHGLDEYPDIGVFTTTVTASGSTDVWDLAIDKYTFLNTNKEYAFDIYQNQMLTNDTMLEDAVYIIFNTPPMEPTGRAVFTYGTISPSVKFEGMQPIIDNQQDFYLSLFGFEQWLDSSARIRTLRAPHRFPIAFPGTLGDFTLTDGGLLMDARASHWTVVPPYHVPKIVEHDILVRENTGQRYMIVNYTPIYIENILVSQHFDLAELDPRSSIYSVSIDTGV